MEEQWDPVMLEEYLAGLEHKVANDQILETRRRLLDEVVIDLRHSAVAIDLRGPKPSPR